MLMFLTLLCNYDSCTSRIDHFLLSESMKSNVLCSAIIDNHLYSDQGWGQVQYLYLVLVLSTYLSVLGVWKCQSTCT